MKVRIVITPPVLLATMLALAAWLPLLAAPQALTGGPTPKSSLSPGRGADPRTALGVPQTIYLRVRPRIQADRARRLTRIMTAAA